MEVPPRAVAVIAPVTLLTDATVGSLLVHVPYALALYNVPDVDGHRLVDPVMAAGNDFTVTEVVAAEPQLVE